LGGAVLDEQAADFGRNQHLPMSVDRATVRRIAHLARIAISDEEEARLEHELNDILDFVAQLDELDTSAVEPMTRVAAMKMKMRKDEVTDGFCADEILKNAPKVDDHYFVVPKIVE
jgi:aspartyl-tRNA(Asn)/glutamyl-tRNA(Gln) amidotransferase subunit C